jgi:hypothetical protein
MDDIGNSKPIKFSETFYNFETILNSIQIQILNNSSHKIKLNSTHQNKIMQQHEMQQTKFIIPKLI